MPKFSKRAKRHAAMSAQDKRRQLRRARHPAPVTISYLPGFEPVVKAPFPFWATINGKRALVDCADGEVSFDYTGWDEETETAWEAFE